MSGLKRDKFPMYRLPESKLQEFLDKIFGGNGGPYDYSISLKNDHWVFKIPSKLTKEQRAELEDLREPQEEA